MKKRRNRVVDYAVYLFVRLIVGIGQALTIEQSYSAGAADRAGVLPARSPARGGRRREPPPRVRRPLYRGRARRDRPQGLPPLRDDADGDAPHPPQAAPRDLAAPDHALGARGDRRPPACRGGRSSCSPATSATGRWPGTSSASSASPPTRSPARLDNPYLDRYIRMFRERTGQKLIPKTGGYEQMLEVLRSGGVLSFLADQDAGQNGLYVDFFGRPASTHKAIALLAIEHRAAGHRRLRPAPGPRLPLRGRLLRHHRARRALRHPRRRPHPHPALHHGARGRHPPRSRTVPLAPSPLEAPAEATAQETEGDRDHSANGRESKHSVSVRRTTPSPCAPSPPPKAARSRGARFHFSVGKIPTRIRNPSFQRAVMPLCGILNP